MFSNFKARFSFYFANTTRYRWITGLLQRRTSKAIRFTARKKWEICRRPSWRACRTGLLSSTHFPGTSLSGFGPSKSDKILPACSHDLSRRFKTDERGNVTRNVWICNQVKYARDISRWARTSPCNDSGSNKNITSRAKPLPLFNANGVQVSARFAILISTKKIEELTPYNFHEDHYL